MSDGWRQLSLLVNPLYRIDCVAGLWEGMELAVKCERASYTQQNNAGSGRSDELLSK